MISVLSLELLVINVYFLRVRDHSTYVYIYMYYPTLTTPLDSLQTLHLVDQLLV